MITAEAINWTQVLITGVPAIIAAIGSAIAVVIGAANRRNLKTPSGDPIGQVVERTHDLSAVSVAATTGIDGPLVRKARVRLNGGIQSETPLP